MFVGALGSVAGEAEWLDVARSVGASVGQWYDVVYLECPG